MELDGLQRCLKVLDESEVSYTTLVTDRHGPVRKFVRTDKK